MTMRPLRILFAFIAAVVVTTVLATAASTQFVLAGLVHLGANIALGTRLETTLHDIAGMGPLYGALILIAFATAMAVAGLVVRYALPAWRAIGYPLAGAVAMLTTLYLLESVLGMMPIAGARTTAGFVVQVLIGAVGGWLFLVLLPRVSAWETAELSVTSPERSLPS
jgi:hypothetical protein